MRIAFRTLAATAAFVLTALMSAPTSASPLTVTVSASGSAIAGSNAIGDYDVMLSFDPAVTVQSVVFGNQLNLDDPGGSFQLEDSATPGALEVLEISFLDPFTLMDLQADSFALFSVLFDSGSLTPAAAFKTIHVATALFGDSIGDPLPGVRVRLASPDAPAVPEPGSMLMMATGLLGGFVMARRSRTLNR